MNTHVKSEAVLLSIAAVERDTGLGKDTLRVWERRYGFPTPGRDAFGERTYELAQVDKLRVIKRLMDAGHRPGRIVAQPIEALQRLSQGTDASAPQGASADAPMRPDLQHFLEKIQTHDVAGLRTGLNQTLVQHGLGYLVQDVVAPLTMQVGEAWMRGALAVFEEHLYTECLSGFLRQALSDLQSEGKCQRPNILLTTFPQEAHGLGLLMAESMMVLAGAHSLSLGTQTPLREMVQAASAHRADVVALSFSVGMNPNQVLDGLEALRHELPATVEIWAGGHSPVLRRRPPEGVLVLHALADIAPAIQRWRRRHQPG